MVARVLDETLTLEVLDDGIGLEAGPRKRRGRGVGLAVTRALVDSLGGSIVLAPREPRGTCAKVELPVKMPRAQHESVPDRHARERGRILLVEDDETLRTLVSDHLTSLGWRVLATDEPWSAIEGPPFDVALLDMNFGGETISSEQVARIRGRVPRSVAVTGDPQACPPVDRVLRKPFELEELVDLVEDLTGPAERGRLAR